MNLKVSHILSFLIGAGLLGVILWISGEDNRGIKPVTGIHQTIFKEQDRLKEQVKNRLNDKAVIESYRVKIQSAIVDIKNIPFVPWKSAENPTNPQLNKLVYPVYTEIDKVRIRLYRSIYYSPQTDNQSQYNNELDNAFSNIDNQLFKSFRLLYDYYSGIDSSKTNSKATAIEDLIVLVKDSSEIRKRLLSLAGAMEYENNRLRELLEGIDTNIKQYEADIAAQNESLKSLDKSSKDRLLMVVVLPVFAIIIILLFVVPYLYRQHDNIIQKLFDEKIILQVFTVFILVIAILLLGIGDKINGETLGTLLGGISVYVLQNALGNGSAGKKSGGGGNGS